MEEPAEQVGTFGERVRMARIRRDLTMRDVAQVCHVSHPVVARWENGVGYPRLDEAIALCEVLDVPMSWLIEGIGARSIDDAIGLPPGFKTGNR